MDRRKRKGELRRKKNEEIEIHFRREGRKDS
jgi:hypothetical protein